MKLQARKRKDTVNGIGSYVKNHDNVERTADMGVFEVNIKYI